MKMCFQKTAKFYVCLLKSLILHFVNNNQKVNQSEQVLERHTNFPININRCFYGTKSLFNTDGLSDRKSQSQTGVLPHTYKGWCNISACIAALFEGKLISKDRLKVNLSVIHSFWTFPQPGLFLSLLLHLCKLPHLVSVLESALHPSQAFWICQTWRTFRQNPLYLNALECYFWTCLCG